jgi:2'-5' RNA ligase
LNLRLFVALELPGEVRLALARYRDSVAVAEPAAVWRPVSAASLHVTLAFLGHRPEEDVEPVAAVLAGLPSWPAPELVLGGALLLPPRRARVLAVALADRSGDRLARLQAEVAGALAAAGLLVPESRAFLPHVTVARLRAGARSPRGLGAGTEPEPVRFAGGPLTLFRSRLGRDGAVYQPLFTRALEGGGP